MPDPFVSAIRRDVVVAAGPDTVTFLQGQLSQDLDTIGVGEGGWSFLLQPQGKVDAWVRVHRVSDEEVRLDVDAGFGDAVLARLQRFKLRTRCDLSLEPAVDMLAVRHTPVAGALADLALACGWPDVTGGDLLGATPRQALARALRKETLDDGATSDGPVDDDALLLYDAEAYDAERIRYGVPAMGAELTADTIPAEVGQWIIDSSISFTKGCFTGQELVARIDSRGGNVPRRLRMFTTLGLPPAPGLDVVIDGRSVGKVTSSAVGASGGCLGLALVHRSITPPAEATVDGAVVHLRAERPES